METAVCYLCDVLLKAQLTVEVYAKISNNFPGLDDVATDRQAEVRAGNLAKVGTAPEPGNLCFRRISAFLNSSGLPHERTRCEKQ